MHLFPSPDRHPRPFHIGSQVEDEKPKPESLAGRNVRRARGWPLSARRACGGCPGGGAIQRGYLEESSPFHPAAARTPSVWGRAGRSELASRRVPRRHRVRRGPAACTSAPVPASPVRSVSHPGPASGGRLEVSRTCRAVAAGRSTTSPQGTSRSARMRVSLRDCATSLGRTAGRTAAVLQVRTPFPCRRLTPPPRSSAGPPPERASSGHAPPWRSSLRPALHQLRCPWFRSRSPPSSGA
jgi:hypothetical protein